MGWKGARKGGVAGTEYLASFLVKKTAPLLEPPKLKM
jgi:hypothetical protein